MDGDSLISAQNRARVRHIQRQLQKLKKLDKVKALANAMTVAGFLLEDAEIIDYMLTGLGKTYNPIVASPSIITTLVTSTEFYSMVLNYEAIQLSQIGRAHV